MLLFRPKGFTLLEIMVVVTIVSFLLVVGIVSFNQSLKESRDKARMAQLEQMRVALELYKAQNGVYPAKGCGVTERWAGPGPHSAPWTGTCPEYIAGLVPDFIADLPEDPLLEYEVDKGYIYTTNDSRTEYKLLIHHSVEALFVDDFTHPYARCPYACTGGAAVYCGDDTVLQGDIYAIFSAGQECL